MNFDCEKFSPKMPEWHQVVLSSRESYQLETAIKYCMHCKSHLSPNMPFCGQGPWAMWDIRSKHILNSNLAKSPLPITYSIVLQLFWNFAQSTAVTLLCSVQNFKMIGQLRWMLWMNEISCDLSLRWVSDGYPILHSSPKNENIWDLFYWHRSAEAVC